VKPLVFAAALISACSASDEPVTMHSPVRPQVPDAGVAAPPQARAGGWTFAVMSDLHVPGRRGQVWPAVPRTVAALISHRPRFVIVTGDHTNGSATDGAAVVRRSASWWATASAALRPLRDAGIPVLPLAGNHDSYLAGQRALYAATFRDLDAWAAPLAIVSRHGDAGVAVDRAPFSYSFDVDGVHFALAHVVAQGLHREVAAWLAADLAHAADARSRLVFGHVPLSSVIRPPNRRFTARFGALLEAGHADAYIAGHEHVVWDEDVTLPHGGALRQVIVGCTSGYYDYSPWPAARARAGCVPDGPHALRCKMPNGGGVFELQPGRKGRMIEHDRNSFTLITVEDGRITAVTPMTVDARGQMAPFYLE
jgi:predicted phosphodiesterase